MSFDNLNVVCYIGSYEGCTMPEHIKHKLTFNRRLPLVAVGWMAVAAPVLIGILIAPASNAQIEQSRPETAKRIDQMFLDDQAEVLAGKPGGLAPIPEKQVNERRAALP